MNIPVDNIYLDALETFGRQIEERRHSSRWSYLEISEKAFVKVSTVGKVERGETEPSAADRERIGEFLGFPIDTFDKILKRLREKDAADRGANVGDLSQHRK